MIRWRYLVTRLIVVAVIVLIVCWAFGPVAGYLTARGIEKATGAKVEIRSTTVGLFPPRVGYNDLRIADPREGKEMRDVFRADSVDLIVDGKALLHRRWVAQNGRITGIQIDSNRETSGHYSPTVPETESAKDSSGMLGAFLKDATGQIGDQAEQMIGGFETVRTSKQIRTRWEKQYSDLVKQASSLEEQIRKTVEAAKVSDNPLRWQELDRTLVRAMKTRDELKSVRKAIDTLPDQFKKDLASLERAKQADIQKIDQYVPGSLSQSDNFGVDLMTNAVREQIANVRSYMDGGRAVMDYTVTAPDSGERSRGVDFDLLGADRQPNMLVSRCEISGLFTNNGDEYMLTGVVDNLSSEPRRLAEPTHAKFQLEGPDLVRVEVTRDRRDGADVDLLTLHWPEIEAKPMNLGNQNDAGITIAGGNRELWVQIRSVDNEVTGRFVSKQRGVKMHLHLDPKYNDSPAAVSLAQSLAGVNSLEIDANFAGTWDNMKLDLNSNIGPVFANAARQAVISQVESSKRKLASKVEETHLRESLALRNWLETQTSDVQALVASADKSIQTMREKVVRGIGDPDVYIGKLRSAAEGILR